MLISKNIKTKLKIAAILLSLFLSFVPSIVNALSPDQPIPQIGSCANQNTPFYSVILSQTISGSLYIKLPGTNTSSQFSLYEQNLNTGECSFVASATAQSSKWTYVTNISAAPVGTVLLIQGESIGAEPYAAVADLLNVPKGSTCSVSEECNTTYDNYSGTLQPNLISDNTDQIAVYVAQPLNSSKISNVYYYANGTFLYSTKKLLPINHDYLGGGVSSIFIQANFTNGEKFIINQTLNTGNDWSGLQLAKSTYYRSHNQVIFFVITAVILIIVAIMLWIARRVYIRRRIAHEHGLDNYSGPDGPEVPSVTNIDVH